MIAAALLPYKWAALAGAALVLVATSGAIGWTAQGWCKDAEIADIMAKQSGQEAKDARADLGQVVQAAHQVATAASQATAENALAAQKFTAIAKDMKNAKPLPADCRPDDQRLRNRNDAIKAYNDARTGSEPGR